MFLFSVISIFSAVFQTLQSLQLFMAQKYIYHIHVACAQMVVVSQFNGTLNCNITAIVKQDSNSHGRLVIPHYKTIKNYHG